MHERCGLALLANLAAATGWHLALTPLLEQRLRAVLDPDGLRLTWEGAIDGHDGTMATLLHTHAAGDVQEQAGTVMFVSRKLVATVEAARAMTLASILVDLAEASNWAALAVVTSPLPDDQLLLTVCRTEGLEISDVALRLLRREDQKRRAPVIEVADA